MNNPPETIQNDISTIEEEQRQVENTQLDATWKDETRKEFRQKRRHAPKLAPVISEEGNVSYQTKEDDPIVALLEAYETSGFTDQDGIGRLLAQVVNAQPGSQKVENANSAIAMLNGIAPQDPLEGLLACQLVSCHNMAMEFSRRAMTAEQSVDGIERNINRATKLMRTFTAQVEALQKYRSKGTQKIVVQHQQVNVGNGGQAIVGDITSKKD